MKEGRKEGRGAEERSSGGNIALKGAFHGSPSAASVERKGATEYRIEKRCIMEGERGMVERHATRSHEQRKHGSGRVGCFITGGRDTSANV